uniref:Nitrilase n=1 Tax=uncultured organism TaxID=155900 RepID=Q6RWN7_9ZZZZ|nr:nitrilase [uncultured organism]
MAESKLKVAAIQVAPVFMDRDATIARACERIAEAARAGAELVVFPEAFVPGYPDWIWVARPSQRKLLNDLYAHLVSQSVDVPSASVDRLRDAARDGGVTVVIGVNERNTEASGASLYNTALVIGPLGQLIGRHRKLVPTGPERMVWAQGDGSTLDVYDTPVGKLSTLICWENYMPLARYAMAAWGARIHVAGTWDRGEPWISTMRHVATEGRVFVISCCMALRKRDIPAELEFAMLYPDGREWINAGDSLVVNPAGQIIAGPLHEQEGILYAELERNQMTGPRWMFDAAGHYARPDVFQLTVNRSPRPMLREAGAKTSEANTRDAVPMDSTPSRSRPRAVARKAARTGRSKRR